MLCVFRAGSVVYSRDVVCCMCLEQVGLMYNRDMCCVFGAGSVAVE